MIIKRPSSPVGNRSSSCLRFLLGFEVTTWVEAVDSRKSITSLSSIIQVPFLFLGFSLGCVGFLAIVSS